MAPQPGYRFLPWTRRGLATGIVQPDVAASRVHATVSVGITVTGVGEPGTQLTLHGPGDIIGIDPRLIVRMEPRSGATDVEPNYLAAVEFDPPDFPWMFTPTMAGADQRLRPWCVLVVVDNSVVAAPHLTSGALLPVIDVPAGAVLTELPDLAESWAWAHTQVLTTESTPTALRAELNGAPDRQLSRLICPRRLEPGKRYCACIVPAFAVGVVRGLGGVPAEDATLTPAWTAANTSSPGDLRLPVYFHWEFVTGPQGDFESLARALKPYKCDASEVGAEKMFIGDAGSGLPQLEPSAPAATLAQDGALRAPIAVSGTLADVPTAIINGLRAVLDAPSAQLAGQATATLGPPINGEWHLNRHTLADPVPPWFKELNLDPRARVAAGLGAEVVRANQEAFMEVCWDQVGSVLDANEVLNRARLALEAGKRVHERHFQPLPGDLLAQVASPLHARVRFGASTVRTVIAGSSLPDATADAAMRRLTSGQRPALKKSARRRGAAVPPSQSARPTLARSLAAGRQDVDPARFVPGGLLQLEFLSLIAPSGGVADLAPVGVPMQITTDQLGLLNKRFADLSALPTRTAPPIKVRANLTATGLLTASQLAEIAVVSVPASTTVVDRRALVDDLLVASVQKPGAIGYLITIGNGSAQTRVDAIDIDAGGGVVVRPPLGTAPVRVGRMTPTLAGESSAALSGAIAGLPINSLDRRGRDDASLVPEGPVSDAPLTLVERPTLGNRTTNTVAPLTRDPLVVGRFETTFRAAAASLELSRTQPTATLVSVDLTAVRGSILAQTDPRETVPQRTASRIRIGGDRIDAVSRPGLTVVPAFDRIMVAPSIVTALYELLAEYDRTRLLPGVDRIPDDGITLLETNARFVTSFLVGANHEMNRELLWRRYPTDQRGTTLRRFWDWLDDGDDVPAIHTWTQGPLGSHARGGAAGLLVLLVRGKLLRRYPNSVIYAWRALGRVLKDPPQASDLRAPMFGGQFAPDITYVGFNLTFEEITQGDGWFFVIQQQPTEPRFGFDELPPQFPAVPPSWSDATWTEAATLPGRHLTLAGHPLSGAVRGGGARGRDAAHLAAVLLQKPMRVALHGSQLALLK
jgi:hypothetical protein